MKVIQLNAVYKIMSTGKTYFDIHNFLTRNNVECTTVYGCHKGEYPETLYLGNFVEHKASALLGRLTGKYYYYSYFSTNKLLRYINLEKPDIVHLGNLHANFINIPKILKYLGEQNIATVITLHDCFLYTGQCCHYSSNGCYKWQNKCNHCKFNKLTWFFDRTERMFNDKKELFGKIQKLAVVGVSDWITNEAKKSPILGGARIIDKIYNGIDLEVFRQVNSSFKKENGLENKKIILGVASGWSNKKGLHLFNELADKLADDEIIILVGQTNGESINSKIINIPATNNIEQIVEIYNAADVFIQASKEESFGKVVAEALACGVPVVTNTSTANPELVDDDSGIVVDQFSVDNIYKAVSTIFVKGKDHFHCRKRAELLFDRREFCNKYFQIYEKLMSI